MSQYYISSENTEDRFGGSDNLEDAISIATEMARKGQVGDLICIEHEGKNIRQFVLEPDGKVAEEALG